MHLEVEKHAMPPRNNENILAYVDRSGEEGEGEDGLSRLRKDVFWEQN